MSSLSLPALLLAASLAGSAPVHAAAVDDETILQSVERGLHGARSLSDADIKVETRDGHVTLSGVAGTTEQIATAGRIAGRARGVNGVTNDIHIRILPVRG